ncbi:MAG TPA: serine hydrolase domain-containing protein, partial [Rhodoferax sp.]|nr:serine hydrolase domain-containing protein [Rhodoferax sp.]
MPLNSVAPEKVGLCPQRLQKLMDVLQAEVTKKRLPGAVAVVARHGQVALFDSVGQLNPATGVVMTTDAHFRIYSMTKPIVSVAIMMLMEEGRLLLSDPVAKFLPEFAVQQVATLEAGAVQLQPVGRAATLHDLL